MGTYTKFVFKASLRRDTPAEVIDLLKRVIIDRDLGLQEGQVLFHHEEVFTPPIDHPFFKCERWEMCLLSTNFDAQLKGGRMYFNGQLWRLDLETEFKNYGGEIEHFIDWIMPYVHGGRKERKYLGWSKHENFDQEHYWVKREEALNEP